MINTDKLNDDKLFQDYYNEMSAYRQKKIMKYKFRKDRNLSLGAGILLDYGLKQYGLNECNMRYAAGNNDKPYFADRPDIHFNISHSGTMVICSFSNAEIGVDIEKITGMDFNIARRFFCTAEYEYIINQTTDMERKEAFFRIWVLKESFMKMTGLGMSLLIDSFEIILEDKITVKHSVNDQIYSFKEYKVDEYRIAICSTIAEDEESAKISFIPGFL
ncbi:MAG: 4'-phosphopantetheinyl transferase superfamily protein [Anaerocolumna sp.]